MSPLGPWTHHHHSHCGVSSTDSGWDLHAHSRDQRTGLQVNLFIYLSQTELTSQENSLWSVCKCFLWVPDELSRFISMALLFIVEPSTIHGLMITLIFCRKTPVCINRLKIKKQTKTCHCLVQHRSKITKCTLLWASWSGQNVPSYV